jgi:hypothetical protein
MSNERKNFNDQNNLVLDIIIALLFLFILFGLAVITGIWK